MLLCHLSRRPKLSQPIVSNGGFLVDPSEDDDWGDDLIVSSESTQSAGTSTLMFYQKL